MQKTSMTFSSVMECTIICLLMKCRVTEADDLTFPKFSLGLKAVSSTSTPGVAPNVYNTDKTELLWFGPASQMRRLPSYNNSINVNQAS